MSDLSAYMLKNVPRYTSYPTAPHFSDVPQATYGDWLSQVDPNKPVSLYLHVPFCKQLCWYCGCNMKLASKYEPLAKYVKTLKKEILLAASRLPKKLKVSHLHWGGGTPTALHHDDLSEVMELLREHFDFLPDSEIAIESDPRTLTQEMIERLGEQGFNRASFGVQEFDEKVQKAINRIQGEEMVRDCVSALRAAGIADINFDLIYGLPYQTLEMIEKTVEISASIKPNRIALFGYAHVPWMAKKQRLIKTETLPGIELRAAMNDRAADLFQQQGYEAIGFDHFALPDDSLAIAARKGELHRNFQGFTNDTAETMIGFGASSIGKTPFGYVQNFTETGAWARAVEGGEFPIARGHEFSQDDKVRGAMIESLLCQGQVDMDAILRAYGFDAGYDADWQGNLDFDEFIRGELISIENGKLTLLDKGRKLVRVVAAVFDAYFESDNKRHSLAV